MTRVSIITPAYNAAAYIGETVRSVLAQTHADWEMIIADDGSTDGTPERAREAAQGDARVKVFEFPPSRLPAVARNRALSQSTGEVIAFLDADDLFEPACLETQLRSLGKHDWSICNTEHFWEDASMPPSAHFPPGWNPPRPYLEELMVSAAGLPINAVMARRDALEATAEGNDIGRLFDTAPPEVAIVEDWDVCLRLAMRADPVYTPERLVRYRHHPEGISKAGERPFVRALRTIERMRGRGVRPELCALAERMQQSKRAVARMLSGEAPWRGMMLRHTALPPKSVRDLFLAGLAALPTPLARNLYAWGLAGQFRRRG